jgi:hypothetical protein
MKISERFYKAHFKWAVKSILSTPPMQPGKDDFIVLSMVQHVDVLPYLLSLKSFGRYLKPKTVVVVADPTISQNDRTLLKTHVPHIEIRDASDFQRDGIPRGGCWERLSAISEYARDKYVVQLDADTVALTDLLEVRQAINDKVSFTLGTEDVQPIITCADAAEWAKPRLDGKDHPQLVAEANLNRFDPTGKFRYARGCAGFAGFAPGTISPAQVQEISSRMSELVGPLWSAWGTEQFASNLIVCSSNMARVLPHPAYCSPGLRTKATVFLHFIGFARYRTALYASLAKKVSKDLSICVR